MTDHDFKDHLIDRELRELLSGDTVPDGLEARIVAAVERRRLELAPADEVAAGVSEVDTVPLPPVVVAVPRTPAPAARVSSGLRAAGPAGPAGSGSNGRNGKTESGRKKGNGTRKSNGSGGNGNGKRRVAGNADNVRWIAPVVTVAACVLVMVLLGVAFWPTTPQVPTNTANDANAINNGGPDIRPINNGGQPSPTPEMVNGNGTQNPQPAPRDPRDNSGQRNVPGPDNPDGPEQNGVVRNPQPPVNNQPTPPDNVPPGPGPIQPEDPGPVVNGGNNSQPPVNQPTPPDNSAPPGPGPDPIQPQPRDPVVDNPTPPNPVNPDPRNPIEPGPGQTVEARPVLASVMLATRSANLRVKRPGTAGQPENDWESYDAELPVHREFVAGTMFKSRGSVDLDLRTGGLLRFDGEITLIDDADRIAVSVWFSLAASPARSRSTWTTWVPAARSRSASTSTLAVCEMASRSSSRTPAG